MSLLANAESDTRKDMFVRARRPDDSSMTSRGTFHIGENWKVSAFSLDVSATWIVIGVMACNQPMPFRTACCAAREDAILLSLLSSFLLVSFMDAMPSDTMTGHNGEWCISM